MLVRQQAVARAHDRDRAVVGAGDDVVAEAEAEGDRAALPPRQIVAPVQHLRAQVGRVEAVRLSVEPHQVAGVVEDHRSPLAGSLERRGEQVAGRARGARGLMDCDDRGTELGFGVEALHVGWRAARGRERFVAECRRGRHGEPCSHGLRSFARRAPHGANGDRLAASERRGWQQAGAGCRDVRAQAPLMAAAARADDGD